LLGGPVAEKSKMKDELPRIDSMGTISPAAMQKDELPLHKDENQVRLDVNRSFVSYPESKSLDLISHYLFHVTDHAEQISILRRRTPCEKD
jgi:hypothetical protein